MSTKRDRIDFKCAVCVDNNLIIKENTDCE
jgi:hypothetical protein